jgi:hypothetical protein
MIALGKGHQANGRRAGRGNGMRKGPAILWMRAWATLALLTGNSVSEVPLAIEP